MNAFSSSGGASELRVKLWRGERMCLLGMDVDEPEDDFVGFAIEVKSPGKTEFRPLRNRLNFSYDRPASEAVGKRANGLLPRRPLHPRAIRARSP